ncbi:subunit of ESCRT-II complex [Scenedesmus sp. NREL 46B-D3]|nr:subunit of ESCRT-II complex [Scenedesmus sp. NREL 46B-D3]
MRRRPGIAGIQRDVQTREQYRSTGEEVRRANLQQMKDQLSLFKSKLEQFAVQHKADIRRDPVFRAQFHTMCANIGVDPLASNKGMWNELLGFGDFYYELGVQLVEACLASRPLNGGLMELGQLRGAVERRRGSRSDPVSEDDIVRAIRKLKVLGGGIDIVTIGRGTYIRSVPGEFNTDKNKVMELAQAAGYISAAELASRVGWSSQRSERVLAELLKEGMAMVDDGAPDKVRLYWFPALTAQQQ